MAVWETLLMLKLSRFIEFFASFFIAILAITTQANASDKARNVAINITPNNNSNTWQAIVTHVTDGDTLRVRPVGSNIKSDTLRIRIDGIDAPESCQTYGVAATAALKKLIFAKQVTISSKRFDDYGREVAKITIDSMDVGSWMVKNGHAWSYHYRFSDGPYGLEEKAAMRNKLGLFADTSAINPKIFRREHGSCYLTKSRVNERDRTRYK